MDNNELDGKNQAESSKKKKKRSKNKGKMPAVSNQPPKEISEQNEKANIGTAIDKNQKLREFAKGFYTRLVEHNKVDVFPNGDAMPTVYVRSEGERPYDALARLLEPNGVSCCAVCFDGEKFLVAFNERVINMNSLEDTGSLLGGAGQAYVIKQMLLQWHIKSIATTIVKLKTAGVEPASGFFYGGENHSVSMLRYAFLEKALPFDISGQEAMAYYSNIMLRFMEFEKNSNASPSRLVDEFWESFNDIYDLPETMKIFPCGLNLHHMEIFKRYLKDMLHLENFIARLPLDDPILQKIIRGEQLFHLVTDGPEGMHGEMRLFNRLLESGKRTPYIGISKLCCAHCNMAMSLAGPSLIFTEANNNLPGIGGYHGNGYKWLLDPSLEKHEEFMTLFLGEDLKTIYEKLDEKKLLYSQKRRELGSEKKLGAKIINYICLFKKAEFIKKGFQEPYLLHNSDLYAPDLPSIGTGESYEEAYFLQAFNALIPIDSDEIKDFGDGFLFSQATRVRIKSSTDNPTSVEDHQVTSLDYVRNTWKLYFTTGRVGTFIISPHFFILRNDLQENAISIETMTKRDYLASTLFYNKVIDFYITNPEAHRKGLMVAYFKLGNAYLALDEVMQARTCFGYASRYAEIEELSKDSIRECNERLSRDEYKSCAQTGFHAVRSKSVIRNEQPSENRNNVSSPESLTKALRRKSI